VKEREKIIILKLISHFNGNGEIIHCKKSEKRDSKKVSFELEATNKKEKQFWVVEEISIR
jgi:hypothetical protein